MSRGRARFTGLEQEFDHNLEEGVSLGGGTFGIFKDLPSRDWEKKLVSGQSYAYRFVPWVIKETGKAVWFLKAQVHKFVGPPKNGRDYLCRSYFGKKCTLCTELEKRASDRYYYNLLVKDGNNWVPKLLEVNASFHAALLGGAERTDPDTMEKITTYFMHPDTGCTVVFTAKEVQKSSYKWIEPTAISFGRPSQISDEDLDAAIDLHAYVHCFENDELLGALDGNHPTVKAEPKEDVISDIPQEQSRERREPVINAVIQSQNPPEGSRISVGKELEPTMPIDRARRQVPQEPQEKLCSMGFVFGSPEHCMKHAQCNTCPEDEYKECAVKAGKPV